jgi:hypothetical protein
MIKIVQKKTKYLLGIFTLVMLLVVSGCAPTAFIPKPELPTNPIKYCTSAIAHISGSKPWIQGGTCCCKPTDALIEQFHKDGFCIGMNTDDLIKAYHDAGIVLDVDHTGCNNMCDHGPHVVKGGKCMSTPTPGTKNFEEVVMGVWEQVPEKK